MNSTSSTTTASVSTSAPTTESCTPQKVKPCCVCTEEKSARDECMLFAKSDNPISECQSMVAKYKTCMAGFGFQIA